MGRPKHTIRTRLLDMTRHVRNTRQEQMLTNQIAEFAEWVWPHIDTPDPRGKVILTYINAWHMSKNEFDPCAGLARFVTGCNK